MQSVPITTNVVSLNPDESPVVNNFFNQSMHSIFFISKLTTEKKNFLAGKMT
jgi:hypothetical protein